MNTVIIDKVREYIEECPYLDEYTALNINYLSDSTKAYSVNESAGYNPIISKDIVGDKTKQFLFNFDSKLIWNEDVQNNIDNSKFFEDFSKWLESNNEDEIFPDIEGILSIEALTNGYIFATNANEAIYRIQCKIIYEEEI